LGYALPDIFGLFSNEDFGLWGSQLRLQRQACQHSCFTSKAEQSQISPTIQEIIIVYINTHHYLFAGISRICDINERISVYI